MFFSGILINIRTSTTSIISLPHRTTYHQIILPLPCRECLFLPFPRLSIKTCLSNSSIILPQTSHIDPLLVARQSISPQHLPPSLSTLTLSRVHSLLLQQRSRVTSLFRMRTWTMRSLPRAIVITPTTRPTIRKILPTIPSITRNRPSTQPRLQFIKFWMTKLVSTSSMQTTTTNINARMLNVEGSLFGIYLSLN